MSIEWLSIRGLRNLEPLELRPDPGINWLHGPNGAGKTSVIEGIHILARGRSFRSATLSGVIQHGAEAIEVVARDEGGHVLGVERQARNWRGRINGMDCRRVSEFAAALPLVLIEPDSHRTVDGGPDLRRQYLDWQLFHVEHGYLDAWRRFARVLQQRNAALRSGADDRVLEALEPEFLRSADIINALRGQQVERIAAGVATLLEELALRLPGRLEFRYRPGHPADRTLAETLAAGRARDRERGFSRHGPHRAELAVICNGHPAATEMSRGQQKLLATMLQLAGLRQLQVAADSPPLLLLDDPVSELDVPHLAVLLEWLVEQPVQCWVTATTPGPAASALFHVEQGVVRPVV